MTENEFKKYINKLWKKGRVSQMSGRIDSTDPQIQAGSEFIGAHSLLPKDYDKIPEDKIIEMGKLLLKKGVSLETKQIILIILAHYVSDEALKALEKYNEKPDQELKYFAQFALQECEWWNEGCD